MNFLTKYKSHVLSACLVLSIPLLFHYDLIFQGRSFESRSTWYSAICGQLMASQFEKPVTQGFMLLDPGTSFIYNEPLAHYIQKSIYNGRIPFWSSETGLGTLIATNVQVGMWFPLHWIQYLIPGPLGIDLTLLAKLIASFLLMLGCLYKGLKFPKVAALCGAVVYAYTGHNLLKINQHSANVYAIFPLYWWALIGIHSGTKCSWTVPTLALSSACLVAAGFPETTLAAFYFGIFYSVYAFIAVRSVPLKQAAFHLLMGYSIALLFSAPILLPLHQVLGYLPEGYRNGIGRGLPPLAQWFWNFIFPIDGRYGDVSHPGWLGLVPLSVCILGICFSIKKTRLVFFLGFIFSVYFLPLIQVGWATEAVYTLPFVNIVRYYRDFSLFLWIPVSVFCAYGTLALCEDAKPSRKFIISVLLTVVLVLLGYAALPFEEKRLVCQAFSSSKRYLWSCSLFGIYVVVCAYLLTRKPVACKKLYFTTFIFVAAAIFCLIPRNKPPRQSMDLERIRSLDFGPTLRVAKWDRFAGLGLECPAQITAIFGLSGLLNVDPLNPIRYTDFMATLFQCRDSICIAGLDGSRTKPPLLAWKLAAVQYFLVMDDLAKTLSSVGNPLHIEPIVVAAPGDPSIVRNAGALPRAFTVQQCRIFGNHRDLQRELAQLSQVPQGVWLDEGGEKLPADVYHLCNKTNTLSQRGEVEFQEFEPETVRIKAQTESNSILVLMDLHHPDWTAKIDGKPSPIFPVFGVFRGVLLPKGIHQVEFRYIPKRFYVGCMVALVGLILCGLLIWFGRSVKWSTFLGFGSRTG
ncbi:MAG: YfhO family protein [Deltaproteobacteria bacterium]|nr:YfhO family protein [Deltaproteobacteria bacterium]